MVDGFRQEGFKFNMTIFVIGPGENDIDRFASQSRNFIGLRRKIRYTHRPPAGQP
jgi:hypothetical protein